MSFTLDQNALELQVTENYTVYKAENAWFTGFPVAPDAYLKKSCWATYQNSSRATAEDLLLGETKIRSELDLIKNFGLASANGVQEESAQAVADQAQAARNAIASGSGAAPPGLTRVPSLAPMAMAGASGAPAPPGSAAPGAAIDVVGSGSILSTKGWSPILNDCFIMGGVHMLRQFHLALSSEEQAIFNGISSAGSPKERWQAFFKRNPSSFWNSQYSVPRVFARELFVLQASGYGATLQMDHLVLTCVDKTMAGAASLKGYCEWLNKKGKMTPKADQTTVVARLEEFLFGTAQGARA